MLVDTQGLIWGVAVLAANITDWEGAKLLLQTTTPTLPRLKIVWADSAYRAEGLLLWVLRYKTWVVEIVTQMVPGSGFRVIPKRWIVERTFGWFGRYRRLSKDYETNPESSVAWIKISMIHRMSRFQMPERNRDDHLLRRPDRRTKIAN